LQGRGLINVRLVRETNALSSCAVSSGDDGIILPSVRAVAAPSVDPEAHATADAPTAPNGRQRSSL